LHGSDLAAEDEQATTCRTACLPPQPQAEQVPVPRCDLSEQQAGAAAPRLDREPAEARRHASGGPGQRQAGVAVGVGVQQPEQRSLHGGVVQRLRVVGEHGEVRLGAQQVVQPLRVCRAEAVQDTRLTDQ
jgi:hypothetical protein